MRWGILLVFVTGLLPEMAQAGPWTHEKGGGYASSALLLQRIDGEDAVRAELFGEYGLTSNWTVSLQAEGVTFPDLAGFDQYAYRATLRRQFWRKGVWRAAFEGGVVGGEAIGGTIGGCDTVGGEARLSFGGGGRTKRNRNWFAFIDGVYREHGNCRRQRIEAGYGLEVFPKWFTTNKVFLEDGDDDARSAKFETTLARRFGRTDLGIGYRQEFGGRFQEAGLILSLEHRF